MFRERLHRAFHPAPRRLGFLHQSHEPRHRRIRRGRRHANLQRAPLVHRPAVRFVPGAFRRGDALARERGLVHGGVPADDDAVEGNHLAGANQHRLAHGDVLDGGLDVRCGESSRELRSEREHRAHRGGRATHGAIFQPLRDAEERYHRRRLAEFPKRARARDGERHERVDVDDAVAKTPGGFSRDGGDAHRHRAERDPSQRVERVADVVQQGDEEEDARRHHRKRRRRFPERRATRREIRCVRRRVVERIRRRLSGGGQRRAESRGVERVNDGPRGRGGRGVFHQNRLRGNDHLHRAHARSAIEDGVNERRLARATNPSHAKTGVRGRLLAPRVFARDGRLDRGARVRHGGAGRGARQRYVSTAAVVVSVAGGTAFRADADASPGDVELAVVDEGGSEGTRGGAVGAAVVRGATVAGDEVDESVAHDEIDVVAVRDGVRGGADEERARLLGRGGEPERLHLARGEGGVVVGGDGCGGEGERGPRTVGGGGHELALDEERLRGRGRRADLAGRRVGCSLASTAKTKHRRVEADALVLARRPRAAPGALDRAISRGRRHRARASHARRAGVRGGARPARPKGAVQKACRRQPR